ncbi:LuxR C-terminal-related transcriptional regulator [Brucepastera parasyntrophica]|uniref:LuxR C-terminal-related transcriptional regulator n=1 Tax=Brucepastera parasyntrophica TaxID=2880008 RepID=UPI00210BEF78|nr:LuxR C-terminal-related transcriptional regulator [Brucepastera parasyntrophica]ULQ60976.1 LuxR C-terminal-related transcriptional regulator [Brucepastera parasyntrophica]
MPGQSNLPLHQGMLRRPRLQALIEKGLEYPFLVLLAGPGFGKTQAMADYLSQSDARSLWVRMGSLDNPYPNFREHFCHSLEREFPRLSKNLATLEFPETPVKFIPFMHALIKELERGKQVIWVFDDFGEITDESTRNFFRMLAKLDKENFRLVLLSNATSGTEALFNKTDRRFLISGDDLRFTDEEISGLYGMYGMSLEPEEVSRVRDYTEGWPLALHLMALQHNRIPELMVGPGGIAENGIFHLFDEQFFSGYPAEQQKLLAGLSLFHYFTKELVFTLHGKDPADLDVFNNHVFIKNEPGTDRFFFHHLYRLFLQEKKRLLSAEEELEIWRKAAEQYKTAGDTIEAIVCYRKCKDHISMLAVICDSPKFHYGITVANAAYFLEHLDLLTPEEAEEYPMADYLRALVYLNTIEIEKSEVLLLDLEQRLLSDGSAAALKLLGDVYASLGAIHMMRNEENFGDYYKKAAVYLREDSKYKTKNTLLTGNHNSFSLPDNLPGARERMEKAVHYGVSWANRALAGGMSGLDYLYSAEGAYLAYELDRAEQYAYRGIYKAEANAQHDLVCNGFCILARTGFMRGNLEEMSKHIRSVADYAERYAFTVLREIRDTALAWYYIKLRDFSKVPGTILAINDSEQSLLSYGRVQLVYANYLINTGEYAKLAGLLEYPKGLFLTRGIWPDRICLFIMLAISHFHLGNPDSAMAALWTAYDMSYNNGLVTLFIEGEKHMEALIDLARRQQEHAFDPQWLDLIARQAAGFTRRAAAVRSSYKKQGNPKTVKENPLTLREVEILQELSRGLTREEIAIKHRISINTIKSFIKTIYSKLNAANRAEAVSIAILNGYIEVPGPE